MFWWSGPAGSPSCPPFAVRGPALGLDLGRDHRRGAAVQLILALVTGAAQLLRADQSLSLLPVLVLVFAMQWGWLIRPSVRDAIPELNPAAVR